MSTIDTFRKKYGVVIPKSLLLEAFTHPSYKNIEKDAKSNSQLETLGDSVLDLIVTEFLIKENKNISSGELTFNRSVLVNNSSLCKVGKRLGISDLIRTDQSYKVTKNDVANATEALFGAIYLNSGLPACIAFFNQIKSDLTKIADRFKANGNVYYNPIGKLNEFAQSRDLDYPKYTLVRKKGHDHDPLFIFEVKLKIEDTVFIEQGSGSSKKKAKIAAAAIMLNNLSNIGSINAKAIS